MNLSGHQLLPHERQRAPSVWPIFFGVAAFIAITLLGAVGFHVIEDLSPLNALYMAVITVSTVGYGEIRPFHPAGRILAIFLIVFGVGAFTFMVTAVGNYVIAIRISGVLERRRMQKQLAEIRDHYILCGYGRMGSEVAHHFKRENYPLVVIDHDEEKVEEARGDGFLVIEGDGGEDEILQQAGIERANALISTLDDDADALFVVLSARQLNPDIFIVARANARATEGKLKKAGAQRVIWPYGDNGRRMAQMALRPNVVEFLELMTTEKGPEYAVEEMAVASDAYAAGRTIAEMDVGQRFGVSIAAIRRSSGEMLTAPPSDTKLNPGDIVIVFGGPPQLARLCDLLKSGSAATADAGGVR